MKHYWRLVSYLRPYLWPQGVLAVTAMLASSGIESSIPFLAKFVFDQVFTQQHADALRYAVLGVFLVAILRGLLNCASDYLSDWIGQRVVTDLRNQLTAHMQQLDLAFFNRQRAGQVVSRVIADVNLVRGTVTDALTSIFQDVTRLLGLIGVALYMDWVLALLAFCLFPIAGLPLRYFSKQLRLTSRRQQEGIGRLNALLHENIQGNRVVKAFGQEEYERRRFRQHNEQLLGIFLRGSIIRALPITEVLAGIAVSGIVWYGGQSVIAGKRTPGELVGFIFTLFLLYDPFKKLVRTNYAIQQGLAGADRVFELMDTHPQVVDRPGAVALEGVRQGIAFHDVGFAYEAGQPVLRHIDLEVAVGQVVALVGMSGGGKSTLADLIPRFYDVTSGRITIDGRDVRDVTTDSLRAHIAVVTQFTFLFNDSIRNNIAYGDASRFTMAEIEAAARAANAHEFVVELPRGYETHIGDLGVRLSGGQRQRIAIARAILKNAPILILDEATSALDTESEGLVQEALERLMANRTTLVVAHRLSTVRRADQIVVLVRGEIVESGTHEELFARGAEYRKLYELQFREVGEGEADAELLQARKAAP